MGTFHKPLDSEKPNLGVYNRLIRAIAVMNGMGGIEAGQGLLIPKHISISLSTNFKSNLNT